MYIAIDPAAGIRVGQVMVDAGTRSAAALARLTALSAAPGLGGWEATVGAEVGYARASIERHVQAWLAQGQDMLRRIDALLADQRASSAIGAVGTQPAAHGLLGSPVVGAMSGFGVDGFGALGAGGTSITIAGPQNAILGPAVVGAPSDAAARIQEMTAAGLPPVLIAAALGMHVPGGMSFSITGHSPDITAHGAANAAWNSLVDGAVASGAIGAIPIAPGTPSTFTSTHRNADGDGWVDVMDPTPTYYNPGSVYRR